MSSLIEDIYNNKFKISRFFNGRKTDLMKDQFPYLKLSEYNISISKPVEETSGAGLLYIRTFNGEPRLFLAEEDRVPVHLGPLKDPRKDIIYTNKDGREFNLSMYYDNIEESERLYIILNLYRYKMCLLREADRNPNESKRLVKLLSEELQRKLEGSESPDFYRKVDFYIGRNCIDRTTKQPTILWQPVWIVFDSETQFDTDAYREKSRVSGVFSAKSFKFDSNTLPSGIDKDNVFWESGNNKSGLKSPYSEIEVLMESEDKTKINNNHFKPLADAKENLLIYLNLINAVRSTKSDAIITENKKGKVKFSNFELSRWGNEALLDNWDQIIDIIIKKNNERNKNCFIVRNVQFNLQVDPNHVFGSYIKKKDGSKFKTRYNLCSTLIIDVKGEWLSSANNRLEERKNNIDISKSEKYKSKFENLKSKLPELDKLKWDSIARESIINGCFTELAWASPCWMNEYSKIKYTSSFPANLISLNDVMEQRNGRKWRHKENKIKSSELAITSYEGLFPVIETCGVVIRNIDNGKILTFPNIKFGLSHATPGGSVDYINNPPRNIYDQIFIAIKNSFRELKEETGLVKSDFLFETDEIKISKPNLNLKWLDVVVELNTFESEHNVNHNGKRLRES